MPGTGTGCLAPLFYHFSGNKHQYLTLGLIPHFYPITDKQWEAIQAQCQCPLGLIPHFYICISYCDYYWRNRVSMPSWAWVVTPKKGAPVLVRLFQCPLGLELLRLVQLIYSWENCFNALSGLSCYKRFHLLLCEPMKFQCPLGLIPHFYRWKGGKGTCKQFVCQCPLGLIPHFYFLTGKSLIANPGS